MNPFIELAKDPVVTLGLVAYALTLLAVSIGLAGWMWSTVWYVLAAYRNRQHGNDYGRQWEVVPPVGVYGRVALLCFLAAVEAALFSALIWLVTP